MRSEYIDVAKGASPRHATGQPVRQGLPDSSPHFRIASNHSVRDRPRFTSVSFIHASMEGFVRQYR